MAESPPEVPGGRIRPAFSDVEKCIASRGLYPNHTRHRPVTAGPALNRIRIGRGLRNLARKGAFLVAFLDLGRNQRAPDAVNPLMRDHENHESREDYRNYCEQ